MLWRKNRNGRIRCSDHSTFISLKIDALMYLVSDTARRCSAASPSETHHSVTCENM